MRRLPYSNLVEFSQDCVLNHPVTGAFPFQPFPHQINLINLLDADHRYILINNSVMMGVQSILSFYALHQALQTNDQCVILLSNHKDNAVEMLDRIKFSLRYGKMLMPYIVENNQTTLAFSNGSKLIVRAVSEHCLYGISPTQVVVSNTSLISHKTFDRFWKNLTVRNTKIILQTNGGLEGDPFHRQWVSPGNLAIAYHMPWTDHPDRDEAWAQPVRTALGEERFKREFEGAFLPQA